MRITLHRTQYEALGFLLACYPGAINCSFSMDGVAIDKHAEAIDRFGPAAPGQESSPEVSRILKAAVDEDLSLGMVNVCGAIDKDLGLICVMLNEQGEVNLVASITY